MVVAIRQQHGAASPRAEPPKLIPPSIAAAAGRGLSQWLVGWWLGPGNALNAATAAALTEAIGCTADACFAEERARGVARPAQQPSNDGAGPGPAEGEQP
jgi:hypothetical protein